MKLRLPLLVSLAVAGLVATGCQTASSRSGNPRSSSHWNAGNTGESLSRHFLGANSYTPETIEQSNREGARAVVLAMRRHFLNDNPENPLQEHRYGPYDRYIPAWHGLKYAAGDLWDATRSAGVNAYHGAIAAGLMPYQLFMGATETTGVISPPPPEDFRVRNP